MQNFLWQQKQKWWQKHRVLVVCCSAVWFKRLLPGQSQYKIFYLSGWSLKIAYPNQIYFEKTCKSSNSHYVSNNGKRAALQKYCKYFLFVKRNRMCYLINSYRFLYFLLSQILLFYRVKVLKLRSVKTGPFKFTNFVKVQFYMLFKITLFVSCYWILVSFNFPSDYQSPTLPTKFEQIGFDLIEQQHSYEGQKKCIVF